MVSEYKWNSLVLFPCDGFHLSSNSTPFTLNVYDTKHVSLRLNNSWDTLASEAEKQIINGCCKRKFSNNTKQNAVKKTVDS